FQTDAPTNRAEPTYAACWLSKTNLPIRITTAETVPSAKGSQVPERRAASARSPNAINSPPVESGNSHDASIKNGTPAAPRKPAYVGQHAGHVTRGSSAALTPGSAAVALAERHARGRLARRRGRSWAGGGGKPVCMRGSASA